MILRYMIFLSLILTGCQRESKWSLSSEERSALQRVFHHILVQEGGVYTLCGDKPMTCFIVGEDLKVEEIPLVHLPRADWKIYEAVSKRFSSNRFLFAKISRPAIAELSSMEDWCFINIAETVATLLEYYPDFRNQLGFDFDPMQEIFNIQNPDSSFWKQVLNHRILVGILCGFGKKNSYLFEEYTKASKLAGVEAERLRSLSTGFSDEKMREDPTIEDLNLPIFRTFPLVENEQYIRKYRKQKRHIETIYHGKDFVETTMEKLFSSEEEKKEASDFETVSVK